MECRPDQIPGCLDIGLTLDLPVYRNRQPGKQQRANKVIKEYFKFIIQEKQFMPCKERLSERDRKARDRNQPYWSGYHQ